MNRAPWFEVKLISTPEQEIQPDKRARVQLLAVMEEMGMTSSQWEEWSTMVKR
jgi:hypothetical protein